MSSDEYEESIEEIAEEENEDNEYSRFSDEPAENPETGSAEPSPKHVSEERCVH